MKRVLITLCLFLLSMTFASRDASADITELYVCSATIYPPGYADHYGQHGFMSIKFSSEASCQGIQYSKILCTTGATHLQCRVGNSPLGFTDAALQTLARWLRDAVLEQHRVTVYTVSPGIGVLAIGISP
jgi:hypothetical protein